MDMLLKWILIVLLVLSSLGTISMIGKPREPVTKGDAMFTVLCDGVLIFWLLSL